jgi:hypothetical protein
MRIGSPAYEAHTCEICKKIDDDLEIIIIENWDANDLWEEPYLLCSNCAYQEEVWTSILPNVKKSILKELTVMARLRLRVSRTMGKLLFGARKAITAKSVAK